MECANAGRCLIRGTIYRLPAYLYRCFMPADRAPCVQAALMVTSILKTPESGLLLPFCLMAAETVSCQRFGSQWRWPFSCFFFCKFGSVNQLRGKYRFLFVHLKNKNKIISGFCVLIFQIQYSIPTYYLYVAWVQQRSTFSSDITLRLRRTMRHRDTTGWYVTLSPARARSLQRLRQRWRVRLQIRPILPSRSKTGRAGKALSDTVLVLARPPALLPLPDPADRGWTCFQEELVCASFPQHLCRRNTMENYCWAVWYYKIPHGAGIRFPGDRGRFRIFRPRPKVEGGKFEKRLKFQRDLPAQVWYLFYHMPLNSDFIPYSNKHNALFT